MKKIFEWSKIETNKTAGTAKARCPECMASRTGKHDRDLYINFNSGVAKCFKCESLSFKDSIERAVKHENFKIPVQTWRNYTKLSDEFIKGLELRKISQSTIIALGITQERYFQPQLKKECDNLVFNFFEGDVIVNKKYRGANKSFTQSTGTKTIFYNINAVIGNDEVYIVEGEFDVLALYEIGIKNAISVPNGANDNDAYWINSEKYLKDIKKYFIAVDNDAKGNDLAEKIAQRLGRWRCERVNFEGKDANDDLKAGVLEKTIYKTTKYPVSGTFKVEDLLDKMMDLYNNGLPDTIYPKHQCFGELKKIFSVMRGHLVVPTGIPSHGKSNFTEWYVLNLIRDYKMKASFFSPEHHPMELHQSSFVQKTFGKNYFKEIEGTPRVSKLEVMRYKEWANEKLYLTSPDNGEFANWDWILEKFKEQLFNYGIDIFVIDAFNKVEFKNSGNKLDQINSVLTKLTAFAQMNNVIIFLIAHPTKMKQNEAGVYAMPTLYDVSGSADFRNQAHDGFCIYRYFEDNNGGENKTVFTNLKTKYNFQGEIGKNVEFSYHVPSGRYYEKGGAVPTFCLCDEIEAIEEKETETPIIPVKSLIDAFGEPMDEEDLIPF